MSGKFRPARMEAQEKYFMQQMGVVPKQVAITLQDNAIRLKPGLMQFMFGNICTA